MASKHKESRPMTSSTVRLVCYCSVLSDVRRCCTTSKARAVGTFVKREITSKDTRTSPSSKCCVWMKGANSFELRTAKKEHLVNETKSSLNALIDCKKGRYRKTQWGEEEHQVCVSSVTHKWIEYYQRNT